jgi:cellobiose phosphorylase
MVETLLGLMLEEHKLHFKPCLPENWEAFTVKYRYGETVYHINIRQSAELEKESLTVDGIAQHDLVLQLVDDHAPHMVEVRLIRR